MEVKKQKEGNRKEEHAKIRLIVLLIFYKIEIKTFY